MSDKIRISELPRIDNLNKDNLFVTQLNQEETSAITLKTLLSWLSNNGLIDFNSFTNSENIVINKDAVNNTASFKLKIENWQSGKNYKENDYIIYKNSLYICNKNSTSQSFPQEDFTILIDINKASVAAATLETLGSVKPDGSSITIEEDGTIHATTSQAIDKSEWFVQEEMPPNPSPQDGWIKVSTAQVYIYELNSETGLYKWRDTGLNLKGPKGPDGITPTVSLNPLADNSGCVLIVNGTSYNIKNGTDGTTPEITSQKTGTGYNILVNGEYLCSVENGEQGPKGDTGDTGPRGEQGEKGESGEQGIQGPQGEAGITPHIDEETKHWFIDEEDTGINAQGLQGPPGDKGNSGEPGITPHIDEETRHWFIGEEDTGIDAQGPSGPPGEQGQQGERGDPGPKGEEGLTPELTIGEVEMLPYGESAYVHLDEETQTKEKPVFDFGIPQGETGEQGITPHIDEITKHWMIGEEDTGVLARGSTETTASSIDVEATLGGELWSEELPYAQTVEVPEVDEQIAPILDLKISEDDDWETMVEQWGYISKAITGDGTITFYCYQDKPTINLNFKIKVV